MRPTYARSYLYRAAVLFSQQTRATQARQDLDQALKFQPNLLEAHIDRGLVLMSLGKYAEALKALDAAVAIDPQSSSVHYLRGQVLLAMDRRAEARLAFDEAVRLKQSTRDELERKISGQHLSDPQLAREDR